MLKKIGLTILMMGVILAGISFRDGIAGFRPAIDLYGEETNVSEIGFFDLVSVDVVEVIGSFASKTTTENGVKTREEAYYIIPAFDGDEYRYIGITVPEKDYGVFDKIMEDTYDFYGGYAFDLGTTTIEKTGCLKKMGREMKQYYYDWFRQTGWYENDQEMKEEALALYIDPIANPASSSKFFLVGIAVTVVGVILSAFAFVKDGRRTRKAVEQRYVTIAGVTYPKATLAHVNASILGQEKIFAAQELSEITGLSIEEAGKIIEKWNRYYY